MVFGGWHVSGGDCLRGGGSRLAGVDGIVTLNSMILIRFSYSCSCINYSWH